MYRTIVSTVGFVVAASVATAGNLPYLYVGDPTAGAVYGMALGDEQAQIVSGAISIEFSQYIQVTPDHALFIPSQQQDVVSYNLRTGATKVIVPSANEVEVVTLGAGSAPGTAVITINPDGLPYRYLILTLDEGTGEWSVDDPGFNANVHGNGPPSKLFLLAEDRVLQLFEEGIRIGSDQPPVFQHLWLDSPEGLIPLPDLGRVRHVTLGPDGQWAAIAATTSSAGVNAVTVLDADGQILRAQTTLAGTVLQNQRVPTASAWTAAAFDVLDRPGITTGDDPSVANQNRPPQLLVPFAAPSGDRLQPDLSGSTSLFALGGDAWIVANDTLNGVYEVEPGEQPDRSFVLHRGTGPEFEDILDIASSPGGKLVVLDHGLRGVRLFCVDPTTGDRNIVFESEDLTGVLPWIQLTSSSKVRLVHQRWETGVTEARIALVEVDVLTGAISDVAISDPIRGVPIEVTATSTGNVRLVIPSPAGPTHLRQQGSTFVAEEESFAITLEAVPPSPPGSPLKEYAGTFNIPAGMVTPVQWHFAASMPVPSPTSFPAVQVELKDSNGEVFVAEVERFVSTPAPYVATFTASVDVSGSGAPGGAWEVTLRALGSGNFGIAPQGTLSATLTERQAPRMQQMAFTPSGELFLLEAFPSRISRYDEEESAVISRTSITSGDPTDGMNRPAQMLFVSDELAVVAEKESPTVWLVNPTTGGATIVMAERPLPAGADKWGFSQQSPLSLAIASAPGEVPAADATGWMLTSGCVGE